MLDIVNMLVAGSTIDEIMTLPEVIKKARITKRKPKTTPADCNQQYKDS